MRPLVLLNQIDDRISTRLRDHPAVGQMLTQADPSRPWEIPAGVDMIVTRGYPGWAEAPARAPETFRSVRWVQVMSSGVDMYPRWLLQGREVATGQGLSAPFIAEYVMAAVLDDVKALPRAEVHDAAWQPRPLASLRGRRLGLLGFGAIGQAVARLALPFGMEIRALRRSDAPFAIEGVQRSTTLSELVGWSDILVLAAPLGPQTRSLISAQVLARANPALHLINVARGGLVDHAALRAALRSGGIRAATLDVTDPEPLPDDDPLYQMENVRITPHLSWLSEGTVPALADRVHANLTRLQAGQGFAFRLSEDLT